MLRIYMKSYLSNGARLKRDRCYGLEINRLACKRKVRRDIVTYNLEIGRLNCAKNDLITDGLREVFTLWLPAVCCSALSVQSGFVRKKGELLVIRSELNCGSIYRQTN
ncbi:hypothetical protein AVEN_103309-1 [Araneus ventricosus]|uniref:Uncharacterized protein n=1 Tax=Araneus ventricosus TaxID=182803 RepID=A0A4Y2W6E4_ARAVE|nr:hypothetical protein AVEN_103309-1 [Araneus ventricosus]